MADTSEHRGWEIESNYSQHWMDDADFDLTEDASEGGRVWSVVALLAALLMAVFGLHAFNRWTEPPRFVLRIPPPIMAQNPQSYAPVYFPALAPGWSAFCVVVDHGTKTIRPNWENPSCRAPQSK